METMVTSERIKVAITGALSQPRSVVADFINATENGLFVEYINSHTHYLVCTKHDSQKARKAARLGTTVISEEDLMDYLSTGRFESTKLPVRPRRWGTDLAAIEWSKKETPEICLMTYCCARGRFSTRRILWVSNGRSPQYVFEEWIGGYDGPQFKSWRADRVIELEILEPHPEIDWDES